MKPNALAHSPIAHRLDPQVRQVVGRLPVEVVSKLSEGELMALYQSISRPQNHGLDVRLSLPVPSGHMYFATVVGLERRRKARRVEHQSPWSAGSFCLTMAMTLLAGFTIGGVGYRMINQHAQLVNRNDETQVVSTSEEATVVRASDEALHPTVLPWVSDSTDCGGASRLWEDGFCYEQSHNLNF